MTTELHVNADSLVRVVAILAKENVAFSVIPLNPLNPSFCVRVENIRPSIIDKCKLGADWTDLTFSALTEAGNIRWMEWMGRPNGDAMIGFNALELGGETGEALNEVKKFERHRMGVVGGTPPEDFLPKVASEIADVVICCDKLASSIGFNLARAVRDKFNATSVKNNLQTRL